MAGRFADPARAQALAPLDAVSACLGASAETQDASGGQRPAFRIVFVNRCADPRNFSWCAEHAAGGVPAEVACAGAGGKLPAAEQSFRIVHRKEFLWRLPLGTRIRLQDCPEQEIPTSLGCAPPPTVTPRR